MKKVLIVEDDLPIARIYQGLTRMEGLESQVVGDGEAALESIARGSPDVVLLDLMLPKVNGIEVLKHIRSKAALKNLPVIVFTNACTEDFRQSAMQAGATHCLLKAGTSPKQVIRLIREALSASSEANLRLSPPPPVASVDVLPAMSVPTPANASGIPASLVPTLGAMRAKLQNLAKPEPHARHQTTLVELCQSLELISRDAETPGFAEMTSLSRALKALLQDLDRNPDRLNPSCLRTIAQGFDCLDVLARSAQLLLNQTAESRLILVLDDDAVSRRLIASAVERVNLRALRLDDPATALEILKENKFSLAFLDVQMPGMDGFEFCRQLRASKSNKQTPVVFITTLSGLEARAQSILSGGNDFVAKPFIFSELAVKALVYILAGEHRSAIGPGPAQPPQTPSLASNAASFQPTAAPMVTL
jgi:CheY-like chemotaxis protein